MKTVPDHTFPELTNHQCNHFHQQPALDRLPPDLNQYPESQI